MYIGRFAPTPSGPLHFGSMIAAIGSYLQAKTQQGQWLLRIEDTDTQRTVTGADSQILQTLEAFGLYWDQEVSYQSTRHEQYEQALEILRSKNLIYVCECTRNTIISQGRQGESGVIYANTCRQKRLSRSRSTAIRLKVDNTVIQVNDRIQADYTQQLADQVGDFHLLRRDQCYAYHLAVVVDDATQGITEVVRGADILDSTPRQIYLQQCLGLPQPTYLHLPVAVDANGLKLSKQTFAEAVVPKQAVLIIWRVLVFLHQSPEEKLQQASLDTLWQWAIQHWCLDKIPSIYQQEYTLAEQ